MNVFNLRRLRLTFLLLCLATVSQLSQGQHMLFHLLAAGQPIANFTTTSQTVAESTGVWAGWSSGLTNWTRRRQLVLDGTSGVLTGFPVMVKLDSTRIDYGQVQNAGQDLRFTDDAGTVLSHQIENWNESGTSIVWVKVPTLASYPTKTSIWMYYGNAVASDGQTAATWDANYAGIWHLDGNANDVTSNAKHGTVNGSLGFSTGLSDQGTTNSGSAASNILLPNGMTVSNVFTYSVAFKTTGSGAILGHASDITYTYPASYDPLLYVSLDGRLRGGTYVGDIPSFALNSPSPVVNDGQWHVATLTGNVNTQSLYLDGALLGTHSGNISMASMIYTYIGAASGSYWPDMNSWWSGFNGELDEVQISTTVRSAAWIEATHLAQKDRLLVSVAAEETPASGLAVITVQLNQPATTTVTIPYTVSGTATGVTDHSRVSGNLVINGGSNSGSLSAYVFRDDLIEGSETAILTLGAPTGATLGSDTVHTVTITDEALSPPDAVNDSINITSVGPVVLPVLANDTDPNGDSLSITSVSSPSSGTAIQVGSGILYTPSGDFGSTDSFTYTISDGRGGTDTATVTLNYQIPFTWIGSGADANWTTTANWRGGVVPGVNDTAYFNSQCTTFCSPTLTGAVSIHGLRMSSSYTGTITQNASYAITVGAGGWTQRAGTFTGAGSAVTITGPLTLSGGTYTATPVTTTLGLSDQCTTTTVLNYTAGTFNHGSGRLKVLGGRPNSSSCHATAKFIFPAGFTVYDFELSTIVSQGGWNSILQTPSATTINVARHFYDYGHAYDATIDVKGNLYSDRGERVKTGVVKLSGTGTQYYSYTAASMGEPRLQIDKPSGAVLPDTGVTELKVWTIEVLQGSFTAPSGALTIGHEGWDTLNLTALLVASGTTFNSNGGTVKFNHTGLGGAHTTTAISAPVGFSLHNVEVGGSPLIFGYYDNFNSATTVAVSGNLLLAGKINNVNWDVSGNITVNGNALAGTGIINSLSGNTTLTHVATSQMPNGVFTVNKTAANNTLTFTSNVAFTGAAQPVTITQGTMDLAGFNLAVPGLLTIGANGKLICSGGTPSYGSLSVTGEMSCGPSLGITWTGNAGDNQWTTAGNWTNNTIPGSSDIAYFNSKCVGANCDVTMNSNVNVKGIVMSSSYAGTITQGAASTVTVGASGWTQVAGTFLGASSAITMDGPFALSGGTFRSTSGIMNINKSYSVTGAPTFTHNSGTLHITTASGGAIDNFIPGTVIYNHVDIHGYDSRIDFLGGTMTVAGDLTLRDSGSYPDLSRIYNATINVNGNITASLSGYGGSATTIRAVGNAAGQTVSSATASSRIPGLTIAAGANNVTLSGNVLVIGTYTYTSSGIFTVTGSTLIFNNGGGGVSQSIVPGSVTYANVSFSGYDAIWDLGGGTLNVGDTLTINDTGTCCFRTVNNGTINASGNVSISGNLQGGSATLRIVGTTNQTVTGTSTAGFPVVEIASTGGTVTLAGTLRMIKNFTYTSGTIDAGTSTLWFDGYGGGPTGTIVSTAVPTFNNVTFGGYGANWTLSGTLAVGGTVRMEDTSSGWSHAITGGTILAYGSVVSSGTGMKGSAVLKLVGTANRTVSGNSVDAAFPSFEVATTAGTSTYSGTFSVYGDYIHTSGTIDPSTSRVMIAGNSYSSISIKPGTFSYNNFDIEGYVTTHTITGTLTVNGTLRLGGWSNSPYVAVNTGSIVANGDVTYYGNGLNGTTTLQFAGATNTILTAVAGAPMLGGTTTIGKSGGAKVSLAAATSFSTAGQDIVISGGTFDLAGFSLSVNDALTINSGATLKCSGGAFSNGGTLTNSGTINCPGYSGYEFNWTGAGGNSNWNTAGNWQGGNVPGVNDTPAFQDTFCGANCNATMNVAVSIKGLQMLTPYTGTITQASGSTINVGSTGWTQAAGTFTGGNSDITISGGATLSGGTFTSTSGILNVRNNFSRTGTFNHGGGTLRLSASFYTTKTVTFGTLTLNNLQYVIDTPYDLYTLSQTGTVSVLGNLEFNYIGGSNSATLNGATLNVSGNISSSSQIYGTVAIRAVGSGNQTITGTSTSAVIPSLEFASTGGTVTVSGTPTLHRSLTYTSGVVSFGTSSVTLVAPYTATMPLNLSSLNFNNLKFLSENGRDWVNFSITGNLNVDGDLAFDVTSGGSSISGGQINVKGNVSASGVAGYGGTTPIYMIGSGSAQLNQAGSGNFAQGHLIVNKSGGAVVTQTSNIALGTAGQNLTVQAGTLSMAGYNLNVAGTLTNNSVLQRGSNPSCGTITAGTYSGTASICP